MAWQQQQQAAGKQQQASISKQAASKQQPAFAPLKEWTNISFKNQRNTKKIELFPGARPSNNEIVQVLKVVMMRNLNFFQAHGLPIRLSDTDTT